MNRTVLIFSALIALLTGGAIAQVTTVDLHSTVRLGPEDPITLDALARIEGPQSDLLASLGVGGAIVDGDAHGWRSLESRALRELIDADDRVHAGSVVVSGLRARLKRIGHAPDPGGAGETERVEPGVTTVRDHVERWLHDRFGATRETLRYSASDHDNAFMRLPTEGRLVEVREVSRRGRVALRVVVYENMRIVGEQGLALDVRIQRRVATATRRIHRRGILNETLIEHSTRWVPGDLDPVDPESAPGMSAARTIDPGQIITRDLVEAPLVIERGDLVSAKSIAGGVVVSMRGRALGEARRGETVELESASGNARFMVRATGVGRGVVIEDRSAAGGTP